MTWVPGPPQVVVVRHLLAEAIREALTVKEPIGDAAITYNVVEALNRLATSIDRLTQVVADANRLNGHDDDDP
jgi:hypothetical protein